MATKITDFERGQADYRGGRRMCPFTVIHRVEAWADGWKTQRNMEARRA